VAIALTALLVATGAAVAELIVDVVNLLRIPGRIPVLESHYDPPYVHQIVVELRGTIQLTLTLSLATVILVPLLAWLDRRAFRVARILTWVFSGLLGIAEVSAIASDSAWKSAAGGVLSTAALKDIHAALAPAWYQIVHFIAEPVVLVAVAVAAILLAQSSAHEFFQSRWTVDAERFAPVRRTTTT